MDQPNSELLTIKEVWHQVGPFDQHQPGPCLDHFIQSNGLSLTTAEAIGIAVKQWKSAPFILSHQDKRWTDDRCLQAQPDTNTLGQAGLARTKVTQQAHQCITCQCSIRV